MPGWLFRAGLPEPDCGRRWLRASAGRGCSNVRSRSTSSAGRTEAAGHAFMVRQHRPSPLLATRQAERDEILRSTTEFFEDHHRRHVGIDLIRSAECTCRAVEPAATARAPASALQLHRRASSSVYAFSLGPALPSRRDGPRPLRTACAGVNPNRLKSRPGGPAVITAGLAFVIEHRSAERVDAGNRTPFRPHDAVPAHIFACLAHDLALLARQPSGRTRRVADCAPPSRKARHRQRRCKRAPGGSAKHRHYRARTHRHQQRLVRLDHPHDGRTEVAP